MTALDTTLVPAALDLSDRLGKSVTFFTVGLSTYDVATGLGSEIVPTSHVRKISPPQPYSTRYIDRDLIQVGDMKCLVAASGLPFTIEKGMTVKIDDAVWKIMMCDALYSGDSIAAFELQLRR